MIDHAEKAAEFIRDEPRTDWHDESLWFIRHKRDKASLDVPEWEQLRELASGIKDNVLSELDHYLEQFEANALQNGVQVHWATDAAEHNRIVNSNQSALILDGADHSLVDENQIGVVVGLNGARALLGNRGYGIYLLNDGQAKGGGFSGTRLG